MSSGLELLPLPEVLATLGRTRSTLHRMVRRGLLPPPSSTYPSVWPAAAVARALAARSAVHIAPDASLLKRARLHAGLTQARLAGLLGVPTQDLGAWERGTRKIPRRHRQGLALVLNTPDLCSTSREGGSR